MMLPIHRPVVLSVYTLGKKRNSLQSKDHDHTNCGPVPTYTTSPASMRVVTWNCRGFQQGNEYILICSRNWTFSSWISTGSGLTVSTNLERLIPDSTLLVPQITVSPWYEGMVALPSCGKISLQISNQIGILDGQVTSTKTETKQWLPVWKLPAESWAKPKILHHF